ncbi:MAG: Divalent-cation tolerance protein CutA [Methanosaeta sp. PtaU1.Bin112]|nr:MAG: Divalent-cation tolerance protein CutA [Methanosaeta sp. PtaU1.Bin112]
MSQPENDFLVIFCTAARDDAEALAKTLVEEHLSACVNIMPIRSCYIWEGKLNLDDEALLIIKAKNSCFESIKDRILMLHSYSVPEIIALPIVAGHQPYLDWIAGPD